MTPEHREVIARIQSSAEAVRRVVAAVPAGQQARRPREGEWSAQEALIHLRNVVVMVHGLRIRRLLYEPDPVFADYDSEASQQASLRQAEPPGDLVEMIVAEHEQIARLLTTLPDASWPREGRHPRLGTMSIEFLARRVADHAEEHAAQIAATAGTLTG